MNLKNLFRSVFITAFLVLTTSMLSFGQIYVNNTNGDDLNGNGSEIKPYKTITQALLVAADGATISIAADTYGEPNVNINKPITLVATQFNGLSTVKISNGITINTPNAGDAVNVGLTGEKFDLGQTNLTNALVLSNGAMHIASANVIISNGGRITRTGASLDNSPTVTNVDVLFQSPATPIDVTAGGEVPANIGTGSLTVNVNAAKTVTFPNAITTTGGITITTGKAVFNGNLNLSTSNFTNSPAGNTVTVTGNVSLTSGRIINTLTGAVTISGNVSWVLNGNLGNGIDNQGNGNVTINGTVNFAKFTGTGEVAVNHTAAINNAGTGNVSLASGFTVTSGTIASTVYTPAVSATNASSGSLVFGGAATLVDLTNSSTGTVSLAGGSVSGTVANNAGGKVELTANTTFSGAAIGNNNAGSVIKLNANVLTISNNAALITNAGKIISATAATVGAGTIVVTGTGVAITGGELPNITIAAGKALAITSPNVYGNVINNGTFNFGAVTIEGDLYSAGATILGGDLLLKGSYSQTAGNLTLGANTFEVRGNWVRTSNQPGDVAFGTSRLYFTGGNAQTFTPGASLVLYDVEINKTANTVLTLSQSLVVNRNFTITQGKFDLGDFNIRMGATGAVASAFLNSGNFYSTTGNGYLIFEGGSNAFTIAGNGVYSNMDIRSGSIVTATSNINFSGNLMLRNGTLSIGANTFTFSNDQVPVPSITRDAQFGQMIKALAGTITRETGVVYDLTYIGSNSVTAAAEWLGSGLNNLTISTGDATHPFTITGPASANTISGKLTVAEDQSLDLNTQNMTLASDGIAHSVVGTVANGTLIPTGDNIVLNGSTSDNAGATATINNLQVGTAASETFTTNNLKVISGTLVVDNGTANVTMNAKSGTITGNVTLTAGALNLTVASNTTNVMAGSVTVTAGTLTLTRGDVTARQTVTGNVTLTGGTLVLGSDVNVNGVTTIAAGNLNLSSYSYTQNGSVAASDFSRTGAGVVSGTGKVVFNATAPITIDPGTTFDLKNVEFKGAAGNTISAPMTISGSLVHTSGALDLNTLTFSGITYTYTAGSYPTGTLIFAGAQATATFAGSVTIPNVTLNSTGTVTIATSDNTLPRTITVSGVFTQTAGDLALGINSLELTGAAGAFARTAGNITMTTGRLLLNGAGLTFNPGDGFAVDNVTVSTAAANSTNKVWTINKSLILSAPLATATPAADDKLVLGNGATVERRANAAKLSKRPVFGTSVNLAYTTTGAQTLDVEVPTANIINNLTVTAPGGAVLNADQAIIINGKLTLATLLNATATTATTVTMADNSTLELQALGTLVLNKDLVRAGVLNIIYNGAGTTSTRELGVATNATTHTAGNVTVKATVALDAAATFTGTLTFDGGNFNQAGNNLFVQGNIVETANGGFFVPAAASTLTFNGANDQTITLNANKNINGNLNIVLSKTNPTNKVELAGTKSSLDFSVAPVALTFVNGLLVTNDNWVKLNSPGTANQGFDRSGVTGTNVSHVVGNVVKNIAGTGRYTFPVGSLTKYRPASFVFATAPIYAFNATVNHKDESPLGTFGLPIVNGVKQGVDIGTYPSFFWLIKSDVPLGQATTFNLELTGAGFTNFSQVADLRTIRRVDGNVNDNPWVPQGSNYDNYLVGADPTVANISSTGGINPAGARFTYGIPGSFGYTVSGTVKYDNNAGTAMKNVIVTLTPTSGSVQKDTTDAQGKYSFANVANGSYTITAVSNVTVPNAFTSNDAQLVAFHYSGKQVITDPLKLAAADVNNSTSINNTDALLILKKVTRPSVVFAKGNWVFSSENITVNNANVASDLKGLATGDINASAMGALAKASVTVKTDSKLSVSKANTISLPIKAVSAMNVGAMTLTFKYPAELVSFENIASGAENIQVNDDKNGNVVVAWADLSGKDGIELNAGDALLTLQFKSKEDMKPGTAVNVELDGSVSEIANKNGEVYNASLSVASLEVAKPTVFALNNNYPNPFNPTTTISYDIPVNGQVSLVVFNTLGEQVATLVNGAQEVGSYKVNFNASNLTSGVYFYRLTVSAGEQNFTQTHKMLLMK